MLGVKFLVLEIGALLLYAGVKGLSVRALLVGDNTKTVANTALSTTSTATASAGAQPQTSAQAAAGSIAPGGSLFG